jgi:glycosyltransferase involved in cell wall biosynthesis
VKTLLVATNATPPGAEQAIRSGDLHRIDYLELSRSLPAAWVDDSIAGAGNPVINRLEGALRLDIRQALAVARLVRTRHYDTVFSMSERVAIPLAYLLPGKIRHVVWAQHPLSPSKQHLYKYARTQNRWHAILTLCHAEMRAMEASLRVPRARIQVLPYHVDTAFFDPALVPAASGDYILSVGYTQRDFPTLVRALRTLPGIPVHFYVGSNWVKGPSAIDPEALPDSITLHPYVHPRVLRERYAGARFAVVSTRRDSTQWTAGCTTVLQSQAMGKPVIATRSPGISEYVVDGETGLLVPPGDPAAMADAIKSLWTDPVRVAAMGRQARAWILETRSLERWLELVTDHLQPSYLVQPGAARLHAEEVR